MASRPCSGSIPLWEGVPFKRALRETTPFLLVFMPPLGFMAGVGYWLLPGILYLAGLTWLYSRGRISKGPRLELYLESVFIVLAGLTWLAGVANP